MIKKILALGDCNTEGVDSLKNNTYIEQFAKDINFDYINKGYKMCTTREMINFYDDNISNDIDIILIQYGLVDSWKTFKYAPYVLYYPDHLFRKIARKIIKKYKKIARTIGLNRKFGTKFTVEPEEYKMNIEYVVKNSSDKLIFLIETIPNKDLKRNLYIKQYNKILKDIEDSNKNCYKIDLYDDFEKNFDTFYLDETHINETGYRFISKKLLERYRNCLI